MENRTAFDANRINAFFEVSRFGNNLRGYFHCLVGSCHKKDAYVGGFNPEKALLKALP